jgi:threonylcarbamoyladenosine tRNA methylthiotransferase MtaB
MTATLKTLTLGCKVNQYETELVREGFLRANFRDAGEGEAADLCVVNTCTVTAEGDSKSRQAIRRLARENPAARIVVMGCYATRAPDELARLPNVAEVVTDKREIPDLLGRFGVIDIPTGVSRFGSRHRAYVKVQDGCLLRCSYCIIPYVRPNFQSRPLAHIVDEVRRLVDNGYREIVLTGIHLGHYGVDFNMLSRRAHAASDVAGTKQKDQWQRLSHLVRAIVALPGDFRIRLSSIEATEVTRELIGVMAEHPQRIAPHLHICLQSGSDAVLRRMRRRWSSRLFIDRCRLVRNSLDNPAITTDIIVGFPGETDADFEATCRVSRECGFSKIHIFPFSPRKGTPAAGMTNVVPPQVKTARCAQLAEVERELRDNYFRSLIGRRLTVLVEGQSESTPGQWLGTSCRYAPVQFDSQTVASDDLVTVKAIAVQSGTVLSAEY